MIHNHLTKDPSVTWFFDAITKKSNNIYTVTGWILVSDDNEYKPITALLINDKKTKFSIIDRPDVRGVYPVLDSLVGVSFDITKGSTIKVKLGELTFNPGHIDNFIAFYSGFTNENKGLIVVDNFYADPDFIRDFAINNLEFAPSSYHKGNRSGKRFILNGTKEKLEKIIGREITNWNDDGYANGVFQWCAATDPLVFHVDSQMYAGMVFLTKDAPFEAGTTFYSSKKTGKRRFDEEDNLPEDYANTFIGRSSTFNFFDSTQFEKIDEVGNVYNRLVLFDAKQIHAASKYFGDTIETSRFFHLFFFDVV